MFSSVTRQLVSFSAKSVPVTYCQFVQRCRYWKMSQMFPLTGAKSDKLAKEGCKSQKLMVANHLIHGASAGSFHLLPWGTRALEKLCKLIDQELQAAGCQKISMPCLAHGEHWKSSGRWEEMGGELLKLKDRKNSDHCLAPTHEEAVTSLVASLPGMSYKSLPLKWYQIGRKFRDEMRPKNGLLRCREFEMKDLYTFDADEAGSERTYAEIIRTYQNLFDKLGLAQKCIKVQGDVGAMGGSMSHEFHLTSHIGEDSLVICAQCGEGFNSEVYAKVDKPCCDKKGCSSALMVEHKGIEVAHAFVLGTKYSDVFKAKFTDQQGKKSTLHMGCYGIGVTRLLAAAIEVLSSDDAISWPTAIAPYSICIIPQKEGYKAEVAMTNSEALAAELEAMPHLKNEVIIDDRTTSSIGKRLHQARKLGIPYIVIAGKAAQQSEPHFEVQEVTNNNIGLYSLAQTIDLFSKVVTINS